MVSEYLSRDAAEAACQRPGMKNCFTTTDLTELAAAIARAEAVYIPVEAFDFFFIKADKADLLSSIADFIEEGLVFLPFEWNEDGTGGLFFESERLKAGSALN